MIKFQKHSIAYAIFIASWLLAINCYSQQTFYSQALSKLYLKIPAPCSIETISEDTIVFCNDILKGKFVPVVYAWDENGMMIHLGWRFLSGVDTIPGNQIIVRFIERELLSLLIADNVETVLTRFKENNISLLLDGKPLKNTYFHNKHRLIDLVGNVSGINIKQYDKKNYEVMLTCNESHLLKFNFPADSELLTGMDKKERDECLALQLKNHRRKKDRISLLNNDYLKLLHDSIFVYHGNSYTIPQINNDLYYLKADSAFILAYNREMVVETFSNVVLLPEEYNYNIKITHKQYGGIIDKYEVNSRDFYDYFLDSYDRYFGIETKDKGHLSGTLILSDRNAGSIHLAYVEVELEELLSGGIMKMQLYSNIPQHNIENLFGDSKK